MTFNYGYGPINSQSSFLSEDFYLPKDKDLSNDLISKRESLTASILNIKEIGQYELTELITAQTWFRTATNSSMYGQSQEVRYGYRRVFDLVALNESSIPNGTTTLNISPVIQGISVPTRCFGSATIAGPQYIFFPSSDIKITLDNTNPNKQKIIIVNGLAQALIQCYCTIEYLKQL